MQLPQALRPTPEIARRAIDDLELRPMVALCQNEFGWSDQDAEDAVYWYREFLWVCYQFPDQPISALSKRADLLWHKHITDTVRYRNDCNRVFGTFLNHVPFYQASAGEASAEEVSIFQRTRRLYRRIYGDDLPPDPELVSFRPPDGPPRYTSEPDSPTE